MLIEKSELEQTTPFIRNLGICSLCADKGKEKTMEILKNTERRNLQIEMKL